MQIPLHVTIELLASCNLRCAHCYVSHNRRGRLTLPALSVLFDQIHKAGAFDVTLTGGEIGLRQDLWEIIGELKRRHFSIGLLSSGTRWKEADWDRLAELQLSEVRLSLYAIEPKVHDAVTGVAGSHSATMATLLGLKERGVSVAVGCPILQVNAAEVPKVIDWAETQELAVGIDPLIGPTDLGDRGPEKLGASPAVLARLFRDPAVLPIVLSGARPTAQKFKPSDKPCRVGQISCFVDSTGAMFPCTRWPKPAGNILDEDFLQIWRSAPEMLRARSVTVAELDSCRGCGNRDSCEPCVALSLIGGKSVDSLVPRICAISSEKSLVRASVDPGVSILTGS